MQRILLVLLLALCAFTLPQKSYACSCTEKTTLESARQSDIIFTGHVVKITNPSIHKAVTTFTPTKIIKGIKKNEAERLDIHTKISSFSCGIGFDPDRDYLVFAYKRDGKFYTDSCLPTIRLSEAEEILKELK